MVSHSAIGSKAPIELIVRSAALSPRRPKMLESCCNAKCAVASSSRTEIYPAVSLMPVGHPGHDDIRSDTLMRWHRAGIAAGSLEIQEVRPPVHAEVRALILFIPLLLALIQIN